MRKTDNTLSWALAFCVVLNLILFIAGAYS